MAIIEYEKFLQLSPRTRKKILCRCDRCGKELMVPKGNLFRCSVNGVTVYYGEGQEPPGFTPKYEYCFPCIRAVRPPRLGAVVPQEMRERIGKKVSAGLIGHKRHTEEVKARLSESKKGHLNPQWKPDRKTLNRNRKIKRACSNLIWNLLGRIKEGKQGRSEEILGYTKTKFIAHIESKFTDGMDWDNMIDGYIIPVQAFLDNNVFDVKIINHLSNLQPLFRRDNIVKGWKYCQEDFEKYIASFGDYSPKGET